MDTTSTDSAAQRLISLMRAWSAIRKPYSSDRKTRVYVAIASMVDIMKYPMYRKLSFKKESTGKAFRVKDKASFYFSAHDLD